MHPPVLLNDSDIRKLVSVTDDLRDQAVITVVLSTGLFLSELIGLDIESLDFDAKTMRIEGKRTRTVPLTDSAISALNRYLEVRPKTPESALFVTERGIPKRLSERSVDHIIRTASKTADLDVSYHDLRNTFIGRLLKKNIPKRRRQITRYRP